MNGINVLNCVRVILCRPEGAMNVGAVCRAVKTMGIQSLVLVNPAELDENEVFKMALHARDVYQNARVAASLPEALKGTALSVGITRRRGVRRKWFSIVPEELAERAAATAPGETALVFGNERAGLDDEELSLCNMACHIPASSEFPSLNLSHAVQILSYSLRRHAVGAKNGTYTPISREQIDSLVDVIHNALESLGYFKTNDYSYTDRYFRDILARSALSPRESNYMEKIFSKLRYQNRTANEPPE